MAFTTNRSDIRTRARDYLYENVADIWTDDSLNRLITEEINSLPNKDIYSEQIWTVPLVVDQTEYALPETACKIEELEINAGTSDNPVWVEFKGWDLYAGALCLQLKPSLSDTLRAKIKARFTPPTDDITALDVPDETIEVVVWGVVVRAYKMLIGYLRGSVSWDTVTKPGDVSLSSVQAWLRDAKDDYKKLVQQFAIVPKPRDIDLVS